MPSREQMESRIVDFLLDHEGPIDDLAHDILDAVLPQVSTVEELEALPFDAKAVDVSGEVWARYYLSAKGQRPLRWRSSRGSYGQTSGRLIAMGLAPLTIVWRPES